MKKVNVFFAVLFVLLLSVGAHAQSKTGAYYFEGKWSVVVKGTPSGDSKMTISLDKKDSTITGIILDSTGTEMAKISKVELTEKEITVYFTAQGYDVYLTMTKKDDDHVVGNLMGMFDAEGDRIK